MLYVGLRATIAWWLLSAQRDAPLAGGAEYFWELGVSLRGLFQRTTNTLEPQARCGCVFPTQPRPVVNLLTASRRGASLPA